MSPLQALAALDVLCARGGLVTVEKVGLAYEARATEGTPWKSGARKTLGTSPSSASAALADCLGQLRLV